MYRLNLKIKRLFDMFSAGILAVFLLPLWIGVAGHKKGFKGNYIFQAGEKNGKRQNFSYVKIPLHGYGGRTDGKRIV